MSSKVTPAITEVSTGVDWLSVTLPKGAIDYQVWLGDCYYALQQISAKGNAIQHRKLQGYEGLSTDNSFVGENEEGGFAQFTGEKANWSFDYTTHPKAHCSRIDIQMTVQTDVMDPNQGKRCLRDARNHNKTLLPSRRRKIDFWLGEGGADTVYIGSANSDQRGRIYNKESQSEDVRYTRCWRYEAVLRNDYATRMFRKLSNQGTPDADECLSFTVEFFRQRGIILRGLEHIKPIELRPIVKTPTDVERKLEWLRKQVQPTLRKLRELGYYTEGVNAALGEGWEEDWKRPET